jgi:hypothetical protein
MTDMILVEKTGNLKKTMMKEYDENTLYKKCGFKKGDDFLKHTEWKVSIDKKKYLISLYGKLNGKANSENKYDFPPPADNMLFFGSCLLVGQDFETKSICNLNVELWEKMYEKLFGGFDDLTSTAKEDENEIDELENIPSNLKTKSGYLKDGFIVDDDDEVLLQESDSMDTLLDTGSSESELSSENLNNTGDLEIEEIGSELEEEDYDYES